MRRTRQKTLAFSTARTSSTPTRNTKTHEVISSDSDEHTAANPSTKPSTYVTTFMNKLSPARTPTTSTRKLKSYNLITEDTVASNTDPVYSSTPEFFRNVREKLIPYQWSRSSYISLNDTPTDLPPVIPTNSHPLSPTTSSTGSIAHPPPVSPPQPQDNIRIMVSDETAMMEANRRHTAQLLYAENKKNQEETEILKNVNSGITSILIPTELKKKPWVTFSLAVMPTNGVHFYDPLTSPLFSDDEPVHKWIHTPNLAHQNHPANIIVNGPFLRAIYTQSNFGAVVDPQGALLNIITTLPIYATDDEMVMNSVYDVNLYAWGSHRTFFLGPSNGPADISIAANSFDGLRCQQFYLACVAIAYHKDSKCLLHSGGVITSYPYAYKTLCAFIKDSTFKHKRYFYILMFYSEYQSAEQYNEIINSHLAPNLYLRSPKDQVHVALASSEGVSYNIQAAWPHVRHKVVHPWNNVDMLTLALMVCKSAKVRLYYNKRSESTHVPELGVCEKWCSYMLGPEHYILYFDGKTETKASDRVQFLSLVHPTFTCNTVAHFPISIDNHAKRYSTYRDDVRVRKTMEDAYIEEHEHPFIPNIEEVSGKLFYRVPECPPPYPMTDPMYQYIWGLLQ